MWLIVGLGNPGEAYENTRHNAGRTIVRSFAKEEGLDGWEEDKKAHALVIKGKVGKELVALVLPETYMNKSGKAVAKYITNAKKSEKLIVVYDDLDLPFGSMKISFGRGSGGHRGLESVIRAIKTKDFTRVRIGISPATPGGKLKKPQGEERVLDFIMSSLGKKDQQTFKKTSKRAREALAVLVQEGRAAAMNQFN